VIFPLINILIFLLLLMLTAVFINHLFDNRKFLEQQVRERTQNLMESERRFQDLVNLLPEMVIETNLTGDITYANEAATNQLQLTIKQSSCANFFQFIQENEREAARQNFQKTLQGEHSKLIEYTAINRNNKTFPILIRSAPINNGTEVSGARMIVIDITERRQLAEQLHRDQKMKAIGLMAGGVAHDLNNILSGIISYPELLLLDLDQESSLRHPLEAIRQSGLDASYVVSDLLTVARGIAANKEIIALNVLIQAYLNSTDFRQLQTRYPHIDFITSLASDLRNISCSPIHVRKCLMNLITNGAEAIHGGGTISVTTDNHTVPLPMSKDRHNVSTEFFSRIIIHDTGSGIAPQDIEHIFEPFYTKKVMGRSGTGLGLAVVWNTMRDHGGTVNVISDAQGTTFELLFPSIEADLAPLRDKEDLRNYQGRGETILVIDDELRQREIASQLLKSLNYKVQTVSSGEEAIKYVIQHHAPDLLVLDMLMPPGQNGRMTFEQILKIHPRQKAIIASGFAEDDDVKATLAMGAEAFIQKPYTLEQIGSIIYNILYR
jgi:PAS domain S-box-containing protein